MRNTSRAYTCTERRPARSGAHRTFGRCEHRRPRGQRWCERDHRPIPSGTIAASKPHSGQRFPENPGPVLRHPASIAIAREVTGAPSRTALRFPARRRRARSDRGTSTRPDPHAPIVREPGHAHEKRDTDHHSTLVTPPQSAMSSPSAEPSASAATCSASGPAPRLIGPSRINPPASTAPRCLPSL